MADSPITTGAASLGASGLADLLTFISDSFIRAKRSRGRILNFINTDASQSEIAQRGQNVTVHLAPAVTSRLLTDGNAKVLDDDVGSSVTVTLNKHRYSAFSLTQIAQAMKSGPQVLAMLMDSRFAGMLNDTEEDVISIITSGFSTNVINSYNTALDEDDFVAVRTALLDNKVPEDPFWYGLLRQDANAYGALSKLSNFDQAETRGIGGSPNVQTGSAAMWGAPYHNVMWHVSNSMPKSGTSIDNFAGHRDAIVMASRPLPMPMSPGVIAQNIVADGVALQVLFQWDGSKLADEVIVHCLYGYAVGREEWGVLIKS